MKYLILSFTFLMLSFAASYSQNVGIDTENPDAKLDVVSFNSGILIPRIALSGTTDATTVPSATTSELIYNTATAGSGSTAVTPGFYYWNGSYWVRIKVGSEGEDDDWYENGATAPDDINDDIYTHGKVSIGIGSAVERLHVAGNIRVDGDTIMTEDDVATQFVILSNGGVVVKLDNNDDGTGEEFAIKKGGPDLNSKVFTVTEAGNTDADGWGVFGGRGEFDGNLTIVGDSRDQIVADNFDFVGTSSFDFFLDSDADNAGATFAIKNDSGSELLAIAENGNLVLYPYGTGSGETGGLRLRELFINGSNYVEIQAPDALGSTYTFTWPGTDGLADQVLQTDGSGVLSWTTATVGTVTSVTAGTALSNSGTAADPILDVTVDNLTIAATGTGGTLEVIGLPSGDGDYIQNQNAAAQSGAVFWTEGDGAVSDFNLTGGDIYGPGVNYGTNGDARLHSSIDIEMILDDDANGSEAFMIYKNGTIDDQNRVFIFEEGGAFKLKESGNVASPFFFGMSAGNLTQDIDIVLPITNGSTGDYLQTDGSGNLSWSTVSTGVQSVTAGTAMSNTGTGTDPILNVTVDGLTIAATGTGGTLEVIGLPDDLGNYIQNQDAVAQSGARFRVEGDGTISDLNVTGGDIFGPGINYGSNSILRAHSQTDFRVVLDADNNSTGSESFQVHKDGSNDITDRVFEVFESGVVETERSYGMLESGASPQYFTRLQSADLSGSDLTFTLPPNDGNNNDVLITDGSGVLNFADVSTLVDESKWDRDATNGEIYPKTITDQVGIGTADPDYDLDVMGDIGLDGYLYHNDDDHTYLRFTPDRIRLYAGGTDFVDIQQDNNDIVINEGGIQMDLRVEGDTEQNLLFADGSKDRVGILTNVPDHELDVRGFVAAYNYVTTIPLWQAGSGYVMNNTSGQDMNNCESGFDPTTYDINGDVDVRLVIRITSPTAGTTNFQLRTHNGTTQGWPIVNTDTWTFANVQTGQVAVSPWKYWAAGTSAHEVHLYGWLSSGSLTFNSAYLQVRPHQP